MGQAEDVWVYMNRFLHFWIIHGCFNNIVLAVHYLSSTAALPKISNAVITFETQAFPHRLCIQLFDNTQHQGSGVVGPLWTDTAPRMPAHSQVTLFPFTPTPPFCCTAWRVTYTATLWPADGHIHCLCFKQASFEQISIFCNFTKTWLLHELINIYLWKFQDMGDSSVGTVNN
jgi:hypothetical protein